MKTFRPGKNKKVDNWVHEWGNHHYPADLQEILAKYDEEMYTGDTVLDIACGPKPLSFNLKSPKEYILIDIVPALGILKKENKKVRTLWEDVDELLRTGKYQETIGPVDTVIASNIFNYINWQELIEQNKQVHSKDGLFFVANWNHGGIKKYFSDNRPANKEIIELEFKMNGYIIRESYTNGKMGIILAQKN